MGLGICSATADKETGIFPLFLLALFLLIHADGVAGLRQAWAAGPRMPLGSTALHGRFEGPRMKAAMNGIRWIG